MKKSIQISAIILIQFFFCTTIQAQQSEGKKDVIFRALQDELTRTVTELNHPEAGKPFFVGFYFTEGEYRNSTATLGAVTSSFSRKIAASSFRLMFGSYEMNDENFQETPNTEMVFPINIAAPIDCDYWGIRRSLWNQADHSYKSASKNYMTKKAYFAKNPSLKPGFPDYIKQEPVVLELPEKTNLPSLSQSDSLTRALSDHFKEYEGISSSHVSFSLLNCNLYLFNTEGTKFRIPFCFAAVDISATITNGGGEKLSESLSLISMEPNDLIHDNTITSKMNSLAEYLIAVVKSPKLEEEYNGPVLYTGNTSVPNIMEALFSGKDELAAGREDVANTPAYRKTQTQNNNNTESKIGKRFMPEAFSVTMKPRLDSYNGIKLFGKTDVDYEGTIPPAEIKLVENGILRDLIRTRVPSSKAAISSNGHNRPTITQSGIYSRLSPGVVFFASSESKPSDDLKKDLIASARSKGLDFALIVRPVVKNTDQSPSAFYMVSVADGSETLLRPVSITSGGGKMINHIAGCSNKDLVNNSMGSENSGVNYPPGYITGSVLGTPTSMILPDVILFSEMTAEALDTNVDKSLLPQNDE
ncbi:MAG: metallopeptidase TldD-related protein [Bacteroidales bacterium]|nr:metallopeptidase TldD-related protein [Bacteroidales bacterium]